MHVCATQELLLIKEVSFSLASYDHIEYMCFWIYWRFLIVPADLFIPTFLTGLNFMLNLLVHENFSLWHKNLHSNSSLIDFSFPCFLFPVFFQKICSSSSAPHFFLRITVQTQMQTLYFGKICMLRETWRKYDYSQYILIPEFKIWKMQFQEK